MIAVAFLVFLLALAISYLFDVLLVRYWLHRLLGPEPRMPAMRIAPARIEFRPFEYRRRPYLIGTFLL